MKTMDGSGDMEFGLLSRNTMLLIDEIIKNNRLMKLIDNNDNTPINHPNVEDPSRLIMDKIIPAPVTTEVPAVQEVNLRVFFPGGNIKNRVVLDSDIIFQVVMHKDLWAIGDKDEGRKLLRPYEIMTEIVKTFEDKSIGTLGVIKFKNFRYFQLDKDYGFYNLEAQMVTL